MCNEAKAVMKIKTEDDIFNEINNYFNDEGLNINYEITKENTGIYPEINIKKNNISLTVCCNAVYGDASSQKITIMSNKSQKHLNIHINNYNDYLFNLKSLFDSIVDCIESYNDLYHDYIKEFCLSYGKDIMYDDYSHNIFIKNHSDNTIVCVTPKVDMDFDKGVAKLITIINRLGSYHPGYVCNSDKYIDKIIDMIKFFL